MNNSYLNSDIKHIAFIMDGNGRWAKKRNLPRTLGHKAGVERIIDIVKECRRLNFKVVSFYCFSTENWKRPKEEIRMLFKYLGIFFKKEIKTLKELEIKINISGDINPLPEKTKKDIANALNETKDLDKMVFNICLNYSGREEIVKICRDFALDAIKNPDVLNELDSEYLRKYLYIKDLPDIDLLVRTSGEQRISNYMLYNLAYSEMIFNPNYWPDYNVELLHKDIEEYMTRTRRFGGLKDEKK